ncbi:hypothetical protein [Brevundimonas sp. M20]|uniref:hypothetical protein n=1 Tax=Brevundimonas sp. M20 TaxID=2591463 RepID=UPI001146BF27|nr:hypothetical protein [Brevundimonas sp. M20]QDH73727.1 hypothetical protein FKQ52_09990 [Brevundimonas sp. M20]
MALLRTLLMLCGALAVLTLGALPASAAGPSAPPCHEMSSQPMSGPMHHGDASTGAPDKTPDKAMKVMACCVMCVAAPAPAPVAATAVANALDPRPLPVARLSGHGPAPEHGPPRG